jgi:MFS family permease
MMAPAGLSILTTTFNQGTDRSRALGVWGAVSGLAAAAGVFLGGVLSQGPGWRWVLFVNLPVCALILAGAAHLLPAERHRARSANFDIPGAVLATAGMLLLVYALVRAPQQGWASARTIGELTTAGLVLAAFAATELRRRGPLFPFSIFRIRGLAAADATQMIAFAGFVAVFFFLTLYMQNVLGYSPLRGGAAYLPVTAGIAVAAGISSRLFARIGTRPVIVAGALIAAGGIYYLSGIPVDGTYPVNLLPGLVILAIGIGAVLVAVTTAANAGVPPGQAGLAAGLLSASQQLGTALGLVVFTAIAAARTSALLAAHARPDEAVTGGFQRALLAEPLAQGEARVRSKAAVAAAAGFTGFAAFELALAAGAPLGRAAMGGAHTYLSGGLRLVSALAVVVWLLAALVVLRRGGYRVPLISARVSRTGTWVLTGLLGLGVLLNLASPSGWERYLQAPITAILAALCLIVARSRPQPADPAENQGRREL